MKRRQLSMFVMGPEEARLERVRKVADPIQAALIPAHVTLCREDEIQEASVELLAQRVASAKPISLTFDHAEQFSGHGILLHCRDEFQLFSILRRQVLGISKPRQALAHITLAHPANPRAPGNSLQALDLHLPLSLTFGNVTLIEQKEAGAPWTILAAFPFAATENQPNQTPEPPAPSRRGSP